MIRKKGLFLLFCILCILPFVCASSQTNYATNNSFARLNFTYDGFVDDFLDYTHPVNFSINYSSVTTNVSINTGTCFANITDTTGATTKNQFYYNSTSQLFFFNKTYSKETLNETVIAFCSNGTISYDLNLTNTPTSSLFQPFTYFVFDPVIVDIYLPSELNLGLSTYFSSQNYTFYALTRNITGFQAINITNSLCNLTVNGTPISLVPLILANYSGGSYQLTYVGNYTLAADCDVFGTRYNATYNRTVTSSALFNEQALVNATSLAPKIPQLLFKYLSIPYGFFTRTTSGVNLTLLNLSSGISIITPSPINRGSLSVADFFLANSFDFVVNGFGYTGQNVYSNMTGNFSIVSKVTQLQDYRMTSRINFDLNNDGKLDILEIGLNSSSSPRTTTLLNNGTNFSSITSQLPDLQSGSLCYGDINDDGFFDVFASGQNSSGQYVAKFYLSNGTNLSEDLTHQMPYALQNSSCAFGKFLNNGHLNFIYTGGGNKTGNNYTIISNFNPFTVSNIVLPNFTRTDFGDILVTDFDNDGLSDILICGDSAQRMFFYKNMNGSFVKSDVFNQPYAITQCTLSTQDYDNDGGLDIALSGTGNSGGDANPVKLLNNSISLLRQRSAPTPPAVISANWSKTNHTLFINWTSGGDSANSADLSYNIEVKKQDGTLIVSKQPSLSTNPAQGYRGNMQFKQNLTLFGVSTGNLVVSVQTINSALQESSWLTQNFYEDACLQPSSGIWDIVNATCTVSTVADNISLNITNSNLTFQGVVTFGKNVSVTANKSHIILDGSTIYGNNSVWNLSGNISIQSVILENVTLTLQNQTNISNSQLVNSSLLTNSYVEIHNSNLSSSTFNTSTTARIINSTVGTILETGLQSVFVNYYVAYALIDQFSNSVLGFSIDNGSQVQYSQPLNLTAYYVDVSGRHNITQTFTLFKQYYYNISESFLLNASQQFSRQMNRTTQPILDDFVNAYTTQVQQSTGSVVNDQTRYETVNFTIGIPYVGRIQFLNLVNLSYLNLSTAVVISQNRISVTNSQLNASAIISFENETFTKTPLVLSDNQTCTGCTITRINSTTLNVTVPHFSEYTLVNNSQINLLSSTTLFNSTQSSIRISYTPYGNISSLISTSGVTCTLSGAFVGQLLPFSNYYELNVTPVIVANVSATVTCSGDANYEPQVKILNLSVVQSGTYFIRDSSFIAQGLKLSSVVFGAIKSFFVSLFTGQTDATASHISTYTNPVGSNLITPLSYSAASIIDLNNDGWNDLVVLGQTSTGARELAYYDNFTTKYNLGYGLSSGSILTFDANFDGAIDILACGENASGQPQTILLENNISQNHYLNHSNFTYIQTIIDNVRECKLNLFNLNESDKLLIVSGLLANGSTITESYDDNIGSGIHRLQIIELHSIDQYSEIGTFTINGLINLISIFTNDTNQDWTKIYTFNGTQFLLNQILSSNLINLSTNVASYPGLAYGQVTNKSILSITLSGLSQGNLFLKTYSYNGTTFVDDSSLTQSVAPVVSGTLSFADVDADSDLDLIVTGVDASHQHTSVIYKNTGNYSGQIFFDNHKPTPPSNIIAAYGTGTLNVSWNNGTDDYPGLTYNLRVGSTTNDYQFLSGEFGSSSNPTQQQYGNMFATNAAQLTLPNSCFKIQVQSVDAAYQKSPLTVSYANNVSEVCDGYDNNCNSQIDEDFVYPGSNLFIYNGSQYNGSSFMCAYYEQSDTTHLSCPTDPTKHPGSICANSGTYSWNTSTKTCDCLNQVTTAAAISTGGSRTSGGSAPASSTTSTASTTTASTTNSATSISTVDQTSKPADSDATQAPAPSEKQTYGGGSSEKASTDLIVEHHGGRTFVTEVVRNTQRTTIFDMTVQKSFPKSMLADASLLKSVTPFTIIVADPVVDFDLGRMDYLQEKPLVYSIPGTYDVSDFQLQVSTDYKTKQALTSEQIKQVEINQTRKAAESLNTTINETVVGNQTAVTISVDVNKNVTSVRGVEIEQFIPKCLLNQINQTVLEAGVDANMVNRVHIKESDPIIVWDLQEVSAATQLTLKLNTLRASDCNDEIKIKTLAKEYIRANYNINASNLTKSFALTIVLFVFFIVMFVLSKYLSDDEDDNPALDHLVQVAKHYVKEGKNIDEVKKILLHSQYAQELIDQAIVRLLQNKLRDKNIIWRAFFSHSITVLMFIITFILDGIEFIGLIPGYLEWVKTVISWILVLIMFYEIDLPKLVFNNTKRWINISLLVGMFLLHLKTLVAYAKSQSLDDHTYFVFDLYAYVLNHAQFFSVTLFYIGALVILSASIAMAWSLQVKEGCLYFTFTHHPIAHTVWQKIKRSGKLFSLYLFFSFAVFNRVVEWLAVAIDTTIFMLSLIVLLLVLASTTFLHYHKPLKRRGLESLVQALSQNSIPLLLLAVFAFAFVQPFFSDVVSQGVMAMFVALILVVGLYTIIMGFKDHFTGLEHITSVVDTVTAKFVKLFSHPSTIFLGISGVFLLQHVAELAIYIIPNITGETNSAYSQLSAGTLLGLFSHQSLIATHLFRLGFVDQITYACVYAISILGGILLFVTPLIVWVLYFMHRNEHPSRVSVKDLFFERSSGLTRLCGAILIFGVPSIIILLITKVLQISYLSGLTDNTDVGVVISAHAMTATSDQVMLLLLGFFAYIWIAALLYKEALRVDKVKSQLVSITLGVSFVSLGIAYVIPYIQSIIAYISVLWHLLVKGTAIDGVVLITLIALFIADLLIVTVVGLAILIFFGLPRNIKTHVVEVLSHIPFFHHLFFLASSLSHIDYYVDAQQKLVEQKAILGHVKSYLVALESEGHHLETIIYQLKIHGYPEAIINTAISQLIKEKKFVEALGHVAAEHISVHQIKKLIPLIEDELQKIQKLQKQKLHKDTEDSAKVSAAISQEMYELFMDRFTHAEIKLALLYATGNLKGDVSIARVNDVEKMQILTLIGIVKAEIAKHKTIDQIVSELAQKGYDPELVLKIVEHPLFNKEQAKRVISQIVSELTHIATVTDKTEPLVHFFNVLYPYQLLEKAVAQMQLQTKDTARAPAHLFVRALSQVIVWVIAATNKGYSTEQITTALRAQKWDSRVISAAISYARFAITNVHHLDQVIEKDYIELSE